MKTGRRAFIAGVARAAALSAVPHAVEAQQPARPHRVGCLWPVPAGGAPRARAALEARLRDLGWQPGRNPLIEHRFADTPGDVPALAVSLVATRVDVIVAVSPPVITAAASATTEIPIVMVSGGDPIGSGFAVSLARPGKNLTGIADASPELLAKNLDILKEIAPGVRRVQILRNPDAYPPTSRYVTTLETAARALQLAIRFSNVRTRDDIERVLRDAEPSGASAVFAMPDAFATTRHGALIAVLALMHRLPALFGLQIPAVEEGGLASYGPDLLTMVRQAGLFVDRILRGARAGDLPIEEPAKFELVFNLGTARALGISIPPTLLARADKVVP